jgi:hypothetical protein
MLQRIIAVVAIVMARAVLGLLLVKTRGQPLDLRRHSERLAQREQVLSCELTACSLQSSPDNASVIASLSAAISSAARRPGEAALAADLDREFTIRLPKHPPAAEPRAHFLDDALLPSPA